MNKAGRYNKKGLKDWAREIDVGCPLTFGVGQMGSYKDKEGGFSEEDVLD